MFDDQKSQKREVVAYEKALIETEEWSRVDDTLQDNKRRMR